ncbi:MAG TPA: SDR family NAD(P)-dependent oxidoreductase, partial [Methylotenera sp.]|nr:SDR family NAD(P)-dependent oxidoreductase [Methylotenera sp.]
MFNLLNKTAVVTGAGSGIGKAIAQLLAKQGAHVYVLDLQLAAATMVADEINAVGGHAAAHEVNVANQQQVIKTMAAIG